MTEQKARELTKPYIHYLVTGDENEPEIVAVYESDVITLLCEHGKDDVLSEVKKWIEVGMEVIQSESHDFTQGYNKALNNVRDKITELSRE